MTFEVISAHLGTGAKGNNRMLKRVPAKMLKLGMYIHTPEGSWMDYPNWKTRFLLRDPFELESMKTSGIAAFVIDTERGADADPEPPRHRPRAEPAPIQAPAPAPLPTVRCSAEEEFGRAEAIVGRARDTVADLLKQARLGKAVDLERTMPVIQEITGSIDRNASALVSFVRIKASDEYTYLHSIAVCALMINLGRQLLFSEKDAAELGKAGLLHDIGKSAIPARILQKPGELNPAERAQMRQHPVLGAKMLQQGRASDMVVDVCLHHHERPDGRGYPFGISGDKLTLAARMAAVCDVYDAITSRRPYREAEQPSHVLAEMFDAKGQFDPSVLGAFIRSVGIYPIGSLVRLKSGRLAIVVEQNDADLTRPQVRAFYHIADRKRLQATDVTLTDDGDEILSREQPERWGFQQWDGLWSQLLRSGGSRLSAAA